MDFIENITTYYMTESRHGLYTSAVSGAVLLITCAVLWHFSQSGSILRGAVVTVAIGSLIFILGGYFAGKNAKNTLPEKIENYQTNVIDFMQTEQQKVEAIHNNWITIRIFWTMFLIAGVIVIFVSGKPLWSGIAIGLLIIGVIGHIEEIISYQHNERYRLEVNEKIKSSNIIFE